MDTTTSPTLPPTTLPAHCDSLRFSTKKGDNRIIVGLSSLTSTLWNGAVGVLHVTGGERENNAEKSKQKKTDAKDSSADDGKPVLWEVNSGVTCADFVGDDDQLAVCACDDGSMEVWNVSKGKEKLMHGLWAHDDIASSVHTNPSEKDTFASSSWDLTVKTWDVKNTTATAVFAGHIKPVCKVEWNKNARDLFVSASEDKTSKVWDRRQKSSNGVVHTVNSERFPVFTATWSQHSEHVFATGEQDGTIKVYDLRHLTQPTFSQKGHLRACHALAFNPHNESWLASGSDDTTLAVWDVKTGTKIYGCEDSNSHSDFVRTLTWNPHSSNNNNMLVSGSWDKTVRYHNVVVAK